MKRRIISLILALCLILSACQPKKVNDKQKESTGETKVESQGETQGEATKTESKKTVTVTTTFLEDMVKVLAGDKVNIELVIPAGADPHLYEPKPQDLEKLKKADLLLYHGLHFEGKMVEVLEQKGKAVAKDFDKKDLNQIEEDGKTEVDPHFWFDLKLYAKAVEAAKTALVELLPEEKAAIEKNCENYLAELKKLDGEIKEKIAQIPEGSRYLVTPHDAFNYFSKAYKMEVMAPQGISTDSEVANKEIEETAQFIADKKIKAIFAETTTNPDRMKKLQDVVKSKGFDVKVVSGEGKELFSDSLAPKGEKCDNFLDMYRHNVDLIVENMK